MLFPKISLEEIFDGLIFFFFLPWIHLEKLISKKINEMATKVAYKLKVTMTKCVFQVV